MAFRHFYIGLGSFSLGLGIIGIFLPLIPTTPLLLLAAYCYAKGSKRLYDWLLGHPLMGSYIKDYQCGQGIPLKVKAVTIIFLWLMICLTAWFAASQLWLRIILGIIAICVTGLMLYLPTKIMKED
jgi:uncharacterized protein